MAVCALFALAASAVEIVDLTAAARAIGDSARTITASSQGSYGPSSAFDGEYLNNSSKQWVSGKGVDQWIQYRFKDSFQEGKVLRLTSYRFGVNTGWSGKNDKYGPCNLPSAWEFLGSNDGEAWDVLDTQSGRTVSDWTSHNNVEWVFPLRINECYRYYRLHLTASLSNQESDTDKEYRIPEIMFYGEVCDDEASITKFRYWNGATSEDWNEPANWAPDADGQTTVPQDGEYVWLGDLSAASISLSADTAELAGLILGGQGNAVTITATGWKTAIRAGEVFVNDKGVVTCGAAAINKDDLNRVWLVCDTLTVAKGGKITVSERGYAADAQKAQVVGHGPGAGKTNMGASHGGYGSWAAGRGNAGGYVWENVQPYGDAEHPETAGSSGANSKYDIGGNGGGVIRIAATGAVTVNGEILANGRAASTTGKDAANHDTAGAGGSIWISCATVAGTTGLIAAKGGNGDDYAQGSGPGAPGGGGRIAIHYNAEAQAELPTPTVTISAAPGYWWGASAAKRLDAVTADKPGLGFEADIGTLWFSDEALPVAMLPTSLTGQLASFGKKLTLQSLTMSAGHVRFPIDGFELKVEGDLALTGTTRLEIGGVEATNRTWRADLRTYEPVALKVGGNLSIASGARLDIRAAETNGTGAASGATVEVAGTMTIGAGSFVYSWSDVIDGGSPEFLVGTLVVEEGGLFSARDRGFSGGHNMLNGSSTFVNRRSTGHGPGGGKYKAGKQFGIDRFGGGAGHGGTGGAWTFYSTLGGASYDAEFGPVLPGSGGAGSQYSTYGGSGGGVIFVRAAELIEVNGEINADGMSGCAESGSGAGGSILLSAPVVKSSSAAVISAKGASSNANSTGAGAGGRILIATGKPWEPGLRRSRMNRSLTPTAEGAAEFLCVPTIAAGETKVPLSDGDGNSLNILPTAGTCWFVDVLEAPGLMLLLR